jgi:hypothetical protein
MQKLHMQIIREAIGGGDNNNITEKCPIRNNEDGEDDEGDHHQKNGMNHLIILPTLLHLNVRFP